MYALAKVRPSACLYRERKRGNGLRLDLAQTDISSSWGKVIFAMSLYVTKKTLCIEVSESMLSSQNRERLPRAPREVSLVSHAACHFERVARCERVHRACRLGRNARLMCDYGNFICRCSARPFVSKLSLQTVRLDDPIE
jgi:hypothetical protein